MTYRADFLLGTILRFLPMVTTILLWQAIYDGLGPGCRLAVRNVKFRYREMIAYLLLTNISRMFSSMPGLAGGIAREIREGTMKRYLVQPIDMIGYLLVVSSRTQGHLHHHVISAVCLAVLPLPRLLRRVSRCPDAGGLRHLAGLVVSGRLLLRGERRDGRLLVSRGHVAACTSS